MINAPKFSFAIVLLRKERREEFPNNRRMSNSLKWKKNRVVVAILSIAFLTFFALCNIREDFPRDFNDVYYNNRGSVDENYAKQEFPPRTFEFGDLLKKPARLMQDDEELVEYVRRHILFHPRYYEVSLRCWRGFA